MNKLLINSQFGRDTETIGTSEREDPVLSMLGIGRYLWQQESGEKFVERLRSEDSPVPLRANSSASLPADLPERIWRRIEKFQGKQFFTSRGLPFTFETEGNGVWFFRDGKRINRKLTRAQVEIAISRCPLKSTTEIKDLMDYPYLFALLMDRRVRSDAW